MKASDRISRSICAIGIIDLDQKVVVAGARPRSFAGEPTLSWRATASQLAGQSCSSSSDALSLVFAGMEQFVER